MSGSTIVYGAFTPYLERALLDHTFCVVPYTAPASLWVALFTIMPTATTPGTEPPGTAGYSRVAVTFVPSAVLPDGSSGVWNTAVLQFPGSAVDWGIILGCGIFDAATSGNQLVGGVLSPVRTVVLGDVVRFDINKLVIGLQ